MRIRQVLVDAPDCQTDLEDASGMLACMRQAAATVGAREQGAAEVRYVPHGLTVVLFLAESHLLVSTWPEHRLALVDVLLCDDQMDPDAVLDVLVGYLRPLGDLRKSAVERVVG